MLIVVMLSVIAPSLELIIMVFIFIQMRMKTLEKKTEKIQHFLFGIKRKNGAPHFYQLTMSSTAKIHDNLQ
jgi:hypothetical protein